MEIINCNYQFTNYEHLWFQNYIMLINQVIINYITGDGIKCTIHVKLRIPLQFNIYLNYCFYRYIYKQFIYFNTLVNWAPTFINCKIKIK